MGYRTTPVMGGSLLARQLREEGCYLAGVPGFFQKEGQWTVRFPGRGILIPVRDMAGHIQGLQVRLDNAEKRKFRWVSSAGFPEGCGAKTWVHLAGEPRPLVLLTEGPMKADVIHFLTGQTVAAVAGVNSLSQLQPLLEELNAAGMEKVMTAFDMDYLCNPHVKGGYEQLTALLKKLGISFGTYLWDSPVQGGWTTTSGAACAARSEERDGAIRLFFSGKKPIPLQKMRFPCEKIPIERKIRLGGNHYADRH